MTDNIEEKGAEEAANGDGAETKLTLGQKFRKAAGWYLWPTGRTTRQTAAKVALLAFALQAVHFTTGALIHPTIKNYLVAQGFDKDTAAKLSPWWRPTLVEPVPQERTVVDNIHTILTRQPTIFGVAVSVRSAFTVSDGKTYSRTLGCEMEVPSPENYSAKKLVAPGIGVSPEAIRDLPVTDEEVQQYVVLHELGHCSLKQGYLEIIPGYVSFLPEKAQHALASVNRWAQSMAHEDELHSDTTAVDAMIGKMHNRRIQEFELYFRATNMAYITDSDFDYGHDLALDLDARINGTAPPTTKELMDSRKELVDIVKGYQKEGKIVVWLTPEEAEAAKNMKIAASAEDENRAASNILMVARALGEHGDTLSPFARRRAILYLLGMHYFTPDIAEKYLPGVFTAKTADAAPPTLAPPPAAPATLAPRPVLGPV